MLEKILTDAEFEDEAADDDDGDDGPHCFNAEPSEEEVEVEEKRNRRYR